MKSLTVLILAVCICLPLRDRCEAAEIRTIGNVDVDLQPLIDWTAKKKGERPLKHWKLLQVLEYKRASAFPVFLCDIEGVKTEIMLNHCPKSLMDLLHQKTTLEAKLAAARKNQEAAAGNLGSADTKRETKQAKREQTAARNAEKTIKKDLTDLDQKIKQHQKIFAMATGASFDGLPVWDTGLK